MTSGLGVWWTVGACVVGLVPAGARWLRVAQREHYLAGSCVRFALRWWLRVPPNVPLLAIATTGVGLAVRWPLCGFATVLAAGFVGPLFLSARGRTSRLVLTRRLRLLAAVWAVLEGIIIVVGWASGIPAVLAAAGLLIAPGVVDVACALTAPIERRVLDAYVKQASSRLQRVHPTVVAVTGSYGKTSTKSHIAHLLTGTLRVVATPASFNNRAGLARAINEHLGEATEVFVAEMGTYGPGEIAELCRWCPPQVAVITAIGPVHLERFRSIDAIVAAKAEIAEPASTVILNTDDPRLAAVADRLASEPRAKRVLRCSAIETTADICVRPKNGTVALWQRGVCLAEGLRASPGAQFTNLACAVAVALELGVPSQVVAARLETIPAVAHRLEAVVAPSGVVVLDDTYNANPAGTKAALQALHAIPGDGRRAVVTPGMVELGRCQRTENQSFAAACCAVATDLLIVGFTNRRALLEGVRRSSAEGARNVRCLTVRTREAAVAWVRSNLSAGDAVLYENDLPDHYP